MNSEVQVLWIDEDRKRFRLIEPLLGRASGRICYADSVEEGIAIAERVGCLEVVILDAVVKLWKENPFVASVNSIERAELRSLFEDLAKSTSEMEANGLVFQRVVAHGGIHIGRTVILSFVSEQILRRRGYVFSAYFQKLSLPDELVRLATEIAPLASCKT